MILNVNVFESLTFKRGQESKEALVVGVKGLTQTQKGLKKFFGDELKDEGFTDVDVMTWKGKVDSLEFKLDKKIYEGKFNNDKKELVKYLAKWLTLNTNYYVNDLQNTGYKHGPTKPTTLSWHLDLKTWDNYEKK